MIICLSANHKKANIPTLETLAFSNIEKSQKELNNLTFVKSCLLLQTCNRIELYLNAEGITLKEALDDLIRFWSIQAHVSQDIILETIDVYEGRMALQHLLLLASGIESMVVGEDQILGQIRKAYVDSKKWNTLDNVLETTFMKAVNVGRRARSETALNEGSISIGSVAVDLAERFVGEQDSTKILLVGAGEAGTIAGKNLAKKRIGKILVANRTYEKGVRLAKEIDGKPVKFAELYKQISEVDVIIVATSTTEPIITLKKVENALLKGRKERVLIIDISQPRGVEDTVGKLIGVDLKNIDNLKTLADENAKKRFNEIDKVKKIVLDELNHLEILLKKTISEPVISSLCIKAEKIRKREINKAFRIMNNLSDENRSTIDTLTRVLVERLLQTPIEVLNSAALNGDNNLLYATNEIFKLEKKQTS